MALKSILFGTFGGCQNEYISSFKEIMLKLAPELLSEFCSVTVRISGVEIQLSGVWGWWVLQPVLKSASDPDGVGEALATPGVSSVGDFVLSFNTSLLDPYSGAVCILSQN